MTDLPFSKLNCLFCALVFQISPGVSRINGRSIMIPKALNMHRWSRVLFYIKTKAFFQKRRRGQFSELTNREIKLMQSAYKNVYDLDNFQK
jgi:hypothetical protein